MYQRGYRLNFSGIYLPDYFQYMLILIKFQFLKMNSNTMQIISKTNHGGIDANFNNLNQDKSITTPGPQYLNP